MPAIIECVPNVSEGRNPETLAVLADTVRKVPGVSLLDIHTDADHNRSVLTLTGSPDCVAEAAFLLAQTAVSCIDLTRHTGVHPRMGAVDVIPFIPILGITMAECVTLSRQVAARIGQELSLPVFLYEKSATAPERENLADIRRGGFEGMAEKLTWPAWTPDFGPCRVHPTAGVTAVGARKPLIAFNMNLATAEVQTARRIARAIRASSGGMPCVKAIGLYLQHRGAAQVSMNLTDYEQTPVHAVFERVTELAAQYGTTVTDSELVGLIPLAALADCAAHFLRLTPYDPQRQIIEKRVWDNL